MTILVVDDEPLNRQILLDMISSFREDYQALSANNGEVACTLATKFKPDIILMDWTMPGMTGLEAAAKIKGNGVTAHIPIVLITGVSDNERLREARESGVQGILVKPVAPDVLLQEIILHTNG